MKVAVLKQQMPSPEEVSAAILSQMEALFGPRLMVVLLKELQENYFGDEFDVKRAIAERPDLFERTFYGVLGNAGHAILAIVCRKVYVQLCLDERIQYLQFGDLAKCMDLVSSKP